MTGKAKIVVSLNTDNAPINPSCNNQKMGINTHNRSFEKSCFDQCVHIQTHPKNAINLAMTIHNMVGAIFNKG